MVVIFIENFNINDIKYAFLSQIVWPIVAAF